MDGEASDFSSLPPELQLMVFSNMNTKELKEMRQVSKEWNNVLNDKTIQLQSLKNSSFEEIRDLCYTNLRDYFAKEDIIEELRSRDLPTLFLDFDHNTDVVKWCATRIYSRQLYDYSIEREVTNEGGFMVYSEKMTPRYLVQGVTESTVLNGPPLQSFSSLRTIGEAHPKTAEFQAMMMKAYGLKTNPFEIKGFHSAMFYDFGTTEDSPVEDVHLTPDKAIFFYSTDDVKRYYPDAYYLSRHQRVGAGRLYQLDL